MTPLETARCLRAMEEEAVRMDELCGDDARDLCALVRELVARGESLAAVVWHRDHSPSCIAWSKTGRALEERSCSCGFKEWRALCDAMESGK